MTLAFGEIIADLINCLLVGYDASGLHILFNVSGTKTIDDLGLDATGYAIIKGAQGATGTKTIAGLTAGFILVMVTLIIVLNLTRSRAGRAIMAIRDNPIAAQSVGLNLTKYKLMAFVTSAALAGAAGALYGLNYSSLQSVKFNFNTSILVLVFVVLGGLGNIWGSLLSAAALTILPEALRQFADYRMLVYAIVLIFVMLATNNPRFKAFFAKLLPAPAQCRRKGGLTMTQKTKLVPVTREPALLPERDADKSPVLECIDLGITFGGLKAVDSFNITIGRTEIAASSAPTARARRPSSTCSRRSISPRTAPSS